MEFLIDNPLARMYGPYFLIFFGFLIFFAVIVLVLVKSQFDQTHKLPLPAIPTNVDPYEVAYLRGGINEVVRSLIFSLMQKGYVEIENSDSKYYVKNVKNPPSTHLLHAIEATAYRWIGGTRESRELFNPSGLIKELESFENAFRTRLEQQQMLTSDRDSSIFKPVRLAVYLMIFSFGAYKLFAALAHGKTNVILLIIMTIAGLIITGLVSKLPRLTKLGKVYLERLQTAFQDLKYTSQAGYLSTNNRHLARQTSFASVDPLLLSVGVFGGGILAGTVFDSYNQAFQRAQNSTYAGGSSCGSAGCGTCTTGSSDAGGSSCSGGSSCGSGCGGCGGGGCS